jgi:pimeloyl-ACP methyl ester carboxylesterase
MHPTALNAGGHRATLDGVDYYYEVRGHGPLCVLLPGGPGMHPNLYGDVGGISEFLTLLTLHPRGAGESGDAPGGDYRLPAYARDVAALLAYLGRQQAIILGHSHGGMIAQRFAIDYPDCVEKLILADTSAHLGELLGDWDAAVERYRDRPWFPAAHAALKREWAGEYQTDEEMGALWLGELPFYFDEWGDQYEPLRAARIGLPVRLASLRQFNADEAPTLDMRPDLARLSVPTLVLVGRYDFITTLPMAEDLARRIPAARLVVFEHSGHLPFVEEPEQWRSAIEDFVTG